MTDQITRLGISVDTKNARPAVRGLRTDLDRLTTSGEKASAQSAILTRTLAVAGTTLAAYAGSQSVGKLVADASRLESINSRIGNLTGDLASSQKFLTESAAELSAEYTTLADGYSRLLPLYKAGVLSLTEAQTITKGLAEVQAATGASSADLGRSIFGLAQGLSAGTLRAEELNQVTEALPGLLQELDVAAGLAGGGFRKLVIDGKVTSDFFKDTLQVALESYAGTAASLSGNITQSFNRAKNEYTKLVSAFAQPINSAATGSAELLADTLGALANNTDEVVLALQLVGAAAGSTIAAATISRLADYSKGLSTAASRATALSAIQKGTLSVTNLETASRLASAQAASRSALAAVAEAEAVAASLPAKQRALFIDSEVAAAKKVSASATLELIKVENAAIASSAKLADSKVLQTAISAEAAKLAAIEALAEADLAKTTTAASAVRATQAAEKQAGVLLSAELIALKNQEILSENQLALAIARTNQIEAARTIIRSEQGAISATTNAVRLKYAQSLELSSAAEAAATKSITTLTAQEAQAKATLAKSSAIVEAQSRRLTQAKIEESRAVTASVVAARSEVVATKNASKAKDGAVVAAKELTKETEKSRTALTRMTLAQRLNSAALVAGATASRAASSALGLVGGPTGIMLVAAAATVYYALQQSNAEKAAEALKVEIDKLNIELGNNAEVLAKAGEATEKFSARNLQNEINSITEQLDGLNETFVETTTILNNGVEISGIEDNVAALDNAQRTALEARREALQEQLNAEIDLIKERNALDAELATSKAFEAYSKAIGKQLGDVRRDAANSSSKIRADLLKLFPNDKKIAELEALRTGLNGIKDTLSGAEFTRSNDAIDAQIAQLNGLESAAEIAAEAAKELQDVLSEALPERAELDKQAEQLKILDEAYAKGGENAQLYADAIDSLTKQFKEEALETAADKVRDITDALSDRTQTPFSGYADEIALLNRALDEVPDSAGDLASKLQTAFANLDFDIRADLTVVSGDTTAELNRSLDEQKAALEEFHAARNVSEAEAQADRLKLVQSYNDGLADANSEQIDAAKEAADALRDIVAEALPGRAELKEQTDKLAILDEAYARGGENAHIYADAITALTKTFNNERLEAAAEKIKGITDALSERSDTPFQKYQDEIELLNRAIAEVPDQAGDLAGKLQTAFANLDFEIRGELTVAQGDTAAELQDSFNEQSAALEQFHAERNVSEAQAQADRVKLAESFGDQLVDANRSALDKLSGLGGLTQAIQLDFEISGDQISLARLLRDGEITKRQFEEAERLQAISHQEQLSEIVRSGLGTRKQYEEASALDKISSNLNRFDAEITAATTVGNAVLSHEAERQEIRSAAADAQLTDDQARYDEALKAFEDNASDENKAALTKATKDLAISEAAAKNQFERSKKFAIAQAVVAQGLTVAQAFADPKLDALQKFAVAASSALAVASAIRGIKSGSFSGSSTSISSSSDTSVSANTSSGDSSEAGQNIQIINLNGVLATDTDSVIAQSVKRLADDGYILDSSLNTLNTQNITVQ